MRPARRLNPTSRWVALLGISERSLAFRILCRDACGPKPPAAIGKSILLTFALTLAVSCAPAAAVPTLPDATATVPSTASADPTTTPIAERSTAVPRSTRTPTATATLIPVGSPPGALVFQSGDSVLYLPADGEPRPIYTVEEGPPPGSPTFSPDCQWVAFTAPRADSSGFQADILAVRVDGTEVRTIASSSRHESGPSWSPDGIRLVFVLDGGELHIVTFDGGARARLTAVEKGSVFAPAWSPIGEVIAYIEETQEGRKIRLVHSDHRPLQDVATGSVTPSGVLSWSPDGMRLAFADEDGDLYIVDIASGITTPVLAMPGRIEGTTWSGNGTTVVFSATREENATQYLWDIYSIDLDDGELRRITTSGKDRGPDLCRMVPP